MRPSPLLHPLAILRKIIGLTQSDMAKLVGRKATTIQSIELKKLQLSPALADMIVHETWANYGWLMAGDPEVPAIATNREPYTKAKFIEAQAKKQGHEHVRPESRMMEELNSMMRISEILQSANAKHKYHVAIFQLHEALNTIAAEFEVKPHVSTDLRKAKDLLEEHLREIRKSLNHSRRVLRKIKRSAESSKPRA